MNLKRLLRDPIYFKIICFFHENPTSVDTPRGIAAWTGENRQTVKKALLELAKLKLLIAHKTTSTAGYSYTRDGKLIKTIGPLLKKLKEVVG